MVILYYFSKKIFLFKQKHFYGFIKYLIVKPFVTVIFLVFLLICLRIFVSDFESIGSEFRRKSYIGLNYVEQNQYRLQNTRRFLKNFDWNILQNTSSNIGIVIISSNRPNFYLTQVVGYLLKNLVQTKKLAYPKIAICNVEYAKNRAELDKFSKFLPIFHANNNREQAKVHSSDRIKKEAEDYWNCLREITKLNISYTVLLEDDAIVTEEFFNLIYSLASQLDFRSYIDYVKLYHPWKLRKIPSIFQSITLSLILSLLAGKFYIKKRLPIILVFGIMFYVTYKYFYNIFHDTRYFLSKSAYLTIPESCCTPAVLFRANKIPEITSELSKIHAYHGYAKDHILDESRFIGRASDMNYVVHIGYYSLLRQGVVELDNTGSFLDYWTRL